MAPGKENSKLKRSRISNGEHPADPKKPRRSERISSQHTPNKGTHFKNSQLPSPLTHDNTATSKSPRSGTATPPDERPHHLRRRTPGSSPQETQHGLKSPHSDDQTQPFSQLINPSDGFSSQVEDEESEGVWGYLIPLDHVSGNILVLKNRSACPLPGKSGNILKKPVNGKQAKNPDKYNEQEQEYEESKVNGYPSSGYLIGRHPECDRVIDVPTVSNRHCLIFKESKGEDTVAIVEDLSGNGTFVNEAYVGRNKRRELHEGDEIGILDESRFVFRYPRSHRSKGFFGLYSIQQELGKGHFATVYLAVDKTNGQRFAVKKFEKRKGSHEKSQVEGLQQEVAVLMSVSHPNVLCLKSAFYEQDGVYLVLELAMEGELFNWIVMKGKLTEAESRKVFIQLFQGLKYLHERNIVHRDIKPENILLTDKDLSVKLADFGLAKIIGEESFTTTLCGTPSYVAPEILENSHHRRYTRAVDVWSLGVVLYICLCGFPPFSDELYTPENPYTLSQQIKAGRFDYPSPYWDPVSDIALDLIDRMMTVDVEKRITVEECLRHPWTTDQKIDPNDSTEGLTGALDKLDFSRRKPLRQRTMLSKLNEVYVSSVVPAAENEPELTIYAKNQKRVGGPSNINKANTKAHENQQEFEQLGTADDQPLFKNETNSAHKPKSQAKGKKS